MAEGRTWGRAEWQGIVSLVVVLAIMVLLAFWPAGTFGWARGWWLLIDFLVLILLSMAVLWRVNPEIFAARSKATGAGTKGWDVVIVTIVILCFMVIIPVGGFDYRFGWSQQADWIVVLGHILMMAGFAGTAWAQAVNRHFEPSVRIQSDRGHTVIDTGPYAIIRHPGYLFGSLMAIGMALALGSLTPLIPALILTATLAVRTLLEERTLVAELPGYAEFRQRTKYRWVPGVW